MFACSLIEAADSDCSAEKYQEGIWGSFLQDLCAFQWWAVEGGLQGVGCRQIGIRVDY